jgi:hypothetical protein
MLDGRLKARVMIAKQATVASIQAAEVHDAVKAGDAARLAASSNAIRDNSTPEMKPGGRHPGGTSPMPDQIRFARSSSRG